MGLKGNRIRKGKGLAPRQHAALTGDIFEDADDFEDQRAGRLDEVDDVTPGELPEGFDEIITLRCAVVGIVPPAGLKLD